MALLSAVSGLLLAAQATAVMLLPVTRSEVPILKNFMDEQDGDIVRNEYGEVRQTMKNHYDSQYTTSITVGNQRLKAIMDTGSFELLVFGVNCSLCGTRPHLYDEALSSSFRGRGFAARHRYGSGYTESVEASDNVEIGPLRLKGQRFWDVYDAQMGILQGDSFASIFGVGPPTSAGKFADADAAAVHEEIDQLRRSKAHVTPEEEAIVARYDETAKRAWDRTSIVENLNLQSMSTCIGKASGSDGYFVWNDTAWERYPNKFLKIDNVGEFYWSASLTNVALTSAFGSSSETSETEVLGCEGRCSAVIDTGTSLIAAPSAAVRKLDRIIDAWAAQGGTCDDLSQLPNLEFSLNGYALTLPPESYVGRATGSLDSQQLLRKVMPEWNLGNRNSACTSLLMPMDVDSETGPIWILGMPFFREYHTTFIFRRGRQHSRLQPAALAFSRASGECLPGEYPAGANGSLHLLRRASARSAQLNIDLSKILVPWLALPKLRGAQHILREAA